MTKLASYRHLVPALFALGWVGCTGSGGPGETYGGGAGGSPDFGAVVPPGGFAGSPGVNMCFNNGVGVLTTGTGGVTGRGSTQFPPQLGTTYSQPAAPPAVSGGTLLVLADGKTAVAADPDRDAIYVVD